MLAWVAAVVRAVVWVVAGECNRMKLAVPSSDSGGLKDLVGEHFGRVPNYTLFDTETNEVAIVKNTSEHAGGTGYPPEILAPAGAEAMLCGGLGRRAIMMFQELGIMVYVGARGTVQDAIQMWKDGQLQAATDETACQQHAFRGEGRGDNCR